MLVLPLLLGSLLATTWIAAPGPASANHLAYCGHGKSRVHYAGKYNGWYFFSKFIDHHHAGKRGNKHIHIYRVKQCVTWSDVPDCHVDMRWKTVC